MQKKCQNQHLNNPSTTYLPHTFSSKYNQIQQNILTKRYTLLEVEMMEHILDHSLIKVLILGLFFTSMALT